MTFIAAAIHYFVKGMGFSAVILTFENCSINSFGVNL